MRDDVLSLGSDELVRLCVEHSHPFNAAISLDSQNAPPIAEMTFLPVDGKGWLIHNYCSGPPMFLRASNVEFDKRSLVSHIYRGRRHFFVVKDTSAAFASVTPSLNYADWFRWEGPESVFEKAWKGFAPYKSALVEPISSQIIQFLTSDVEPEAKNSAFNKMRSVAEQVDATRQTLQLAQICRELSLMSMAKLALLAAFNSTGGRIDIRHDKKPSIVLAAPDDRAHKSRRYNH